MPLCLNCGSQEFRTDVVTGVPVNQAYSSTRYDHQHFHWNQVHSDICVKCGQMNIHIYQSPIKELTEDD